MNTKKKLQEAMESFKTVQNMLAEDFGVAPHRPEETLAPEMAPEGPEEAPKEMGHEDIAHYHGGNEQQVPQEEERTDMNLSKRDKRIAQIREVALDGLQDYAQDVDSEAYQFYKKIWLMCDKAVSEKDSVANGGAGA